MTTTHIRRTCLTCRSMPALSASCPWPGTTASPCAWSCWAVTSSCPARKDGAALPCCPSCALPTPARSCSDFTPPSLCPETREAARRAPLPHIGAGTTALHFMGSLQVGCRDGSCPFAPLAKGETPSCSWGLAGGPFPATGAFFGDPIPQTGLCWETTSCNQGLAASSQLSLETNFLPLFASASSREAAASAVPCLCCSVGLSSFAGLRAGTPGLQPLMSLLLPAWLQEGAPKNLCGCCPLPILPGPGSSCLRCQHRIVQGE